MTQTKQENQAKPQVRYGIGQRIPLNPDGTKGELISIEKLQELSHDKNTRIQTQECSSAENEFIRPYFDIDVKISEIDGKSQFTEKESVEYLKEALDWINTKLEVKSNKDIAVCSACVKKKVSFHIFYPKLSVNRSIFLDCIKQWRNEMKPLYIDTGVYGKTQNFRMLNAPKWDPESGILRKYSNTELGITHKDFSDYLFTYLDGQESTVKLPQIPIKIPIKIKSKTQKITHNADAEIDCSKYVALLNAKRSTEYATWKDVGLCLKGIGASFADFDTFSRKSKKYDSEHVKDFWENAKPNGELTIGSLKYWCNEDNPQKCAALIHDDEHNNFCEQKYEQLKEEFESHTALIRSNGDYIVDEFGKAKIVTKKQLTNMYEHLNYGYAAKDGKIIKTEPLSFIYRWLTDESKKSVIDVGVYPPPMKCPDNHYNLWQSYPFEDYEVDDSEEMQKKVDLLEKHILIQCGNDTEVSDYFKTMLSFNFNLPAEKTGIFPIFSGDEGCGKGTLFKMVEKMIGNDKYLETSSPEQDVWGAFNQLMLGTQFVIVNELGKMNQKGFAYKIKAVISDENMVIQGKGTNQLTIVSNHQLIGATNDTDPVSTDKKDRRKIIISCSNELVDNQEYYSTINSYIADDSVMAAMFHRLKSIPFDRFRFMKKPVTEQMKIIQDNSTPVVEQFLMYLAESTKEDTLVMSNKELMKAFMRFKDENSILYEASSKMLTKQIELTLMNDKAVEPSRSKTSRGKEFDLKKIRDKYQMGFQG